MKVVTPKEMARIEALAYEAGCEEETFMEQAGKGVAQQVHRFCQSHQRDRRVTLLCGKGNNAGDAYVAGRYLIEQGYEVDAVRVRPIEECSELCQLNQERFLKRGGQDTQFSLDQPPVYSKRGVLLDGVFGTGFHGAARGAYGNLIQSANHCHLPILAIDIPSGLDGEQGSTEGPAIQADETYFLGLPKQGFFLRSGWNHVGHLHHVDFGLPSKFIDRAQTKLHLPQEEQLRGLLPSVRRDRHKYQAGLVVGVGGSPGMPGAAILAIVAALKGGAGIVRLVHPDGMQSELSSCPPEIIRIAYSMHSLNKVTEQLNAASAVFLGPGMGRTALAQVLLELVLPQLSKPAVLDADALYHLAARPVTLPEQCILTPHLGEMCTLLHRQDKPELSEEFLAECQAYAEEKKVTLILKGGPSFIFHPGMQPFVNIYGDPGMATAGAGDVFTGLLAALLGQGLSPQSAALLGTYLHAKAGEYASERLTAYSVCASDITQEFPSAFKLAMQT